MYELFYVDFPSADVPVGFFKFKFSVISVCMLITAAASAA